MLLFLVLAFSFTYRVLLMHQATFPPGADIGLHNSVMHSTTVSGNTDFFWNFYQMGGGLSFTFPGYHIFVAFVVSMTRLPDFLAHSFSVSLFSTITVACSFLIAHKVWRESAGLIVAFLVAVSRFDLEMLLWGGFPNIATLMLMPLTFYLFLQRERFTLFPFFISTALLSGSVYVTHSLSAVIFITIVFAMAIFAFALSKQLCISRKYLATWILPLVFGALVASPFLFKAIPAYLDANREIVTGNISDIRQALLSTRILPLEIVVPLFACVVFFFLFSKEYKGKYITFPVLLLTLWILIPMFFTQSYLLGLYTDYNRFLYFVLLPVIILIGVSIDHCAGFFARIADMYQFFKGEFAEKWKNTSNSWLKLQWRLTSKNVYASFVVTFLLIAFLFVPVFLTPNQGVAVQSFYQVMTGPGYDAIQWARENTAVRSVFISDALYGWWFSGFALRPTLSAVDPQYLTLSRELEPAVAAKSLLDTNYIVDNGLIQVREDGGYTNRHNPMFLAKLNWSYFPYPFFNFNNDKTSIELMERGKPRLFYLSQLLVKEMYAQNNSENALVCVTKENDLFNYTQILTVYKGLRFVNMTIIVQSVSKDVTLNSVHFNLQTKGEVMARTRTVGFLDLDAKVLGQLIFAENQPINLGPELDFTLEGGARAEIEIWASAFSISDDPEKYENKEKKRAFLGKMMDGNVNSYTEPPEDLSPTIDLSIRVLDYRKILGEQGVSYVACRDPQMIPKFARDPAFDLVFINNEVALFRVRRTLG